MRDLLYRPQRYLSEADDDDEDEDDEEENDEDGEDEDEIKKGAKNKGDDKAGKPIKFRIGNDNDDNGDSRADECGLSSKTIWRA